MSFPYNSWKNDYLEDTSEVPKRIRLQDLNESEYTNGHDKMKQIAKPIITEIKLYTKTQKNNDKHVRVSSSCLNRYSNVYKNSTKLLFDSFNADNEVKVLNNDSQTEEYLINSPVISTKALFCSTPNNVFITPNFILRSKNYTQFPPSSVILVPETDQINNKIHSLGNDITIPDTPNLSYYSFNNIKCDSFSSSFIGSIFDTPNASKVLNKIIPGRVKKDLNKHELFIPKQVYNHFTKAITPDFNKQIKYASEYFPKITEDKMIKYITSHSLISDMVKDSEDISVDGNSQPNVRRSNRLSNNLNKLNDNKLHSSSLSKGRKSKKSIQINLRRSARLSEVNKSLNKAISFVKTNVVDIDNHDLKEDKMLKAVEKCNKELSTIKHYMTKEKRLLFCDYNAIYISLKCLYPKSKLRIVIETCGGTVTDNYRQASLVIDAKKVNALSVSSTWIIDCIKEGRILDHSEYCVA